MNRLDRKAHGRRGVSLVEVVVATAILIPTLLGSLRSSVQSQKLLVSARETKIALRVIERAMESIRASEAEPTVFTDPAGDEQYDFGLAVPAQLNGQVVAVYPEPALGVLSDARPFRLRLSWTSASGLARRIDRVEVR